MADTRTDDAEVFRPQVLGHLQTADDLDAYIQVTSPSGWIVLAASVIFLAAILIWSNTALIPTTRTFSGLQSDRYVNAWVDEATYRNIKDGQTTAKVAGIKARLLSIDDTPMSRSEILGYLQYDYLTRAATTFDWNYVIVLELEDDLKINERTEPTKFSNPDGDGDPDGDPDEGSDEVPDEGSDEEYYEDSDEDTTATSYDSRLVPVDVTTAETHPIRLVFQGE